MKKLLCLILATVLVLSIGASAMAEGYKIAILTGTTSQGEEEIRAAERELKNDPEHIITDTYPDNFMAEQETTISKLVAFASDPEVKAIIMCQAVPGASPAFTKIREMGRDDILLIAGVPQETPSVISEAADVVLYADEGSQGDSIMEKCAEWGIDVFIHYSFPRHMAMEPIVARHDRLVANAEALGIEMVDVVAPDPMGEGGGGAAQQFILEDVPAQVKKYEGKKVAFFSTNCVMQEPLQTAVLAQENAYYPLPCCPSPYHGFPATLSLKLELGGDNTEALKAVATALNEKGAAGRFSTWGTPINMSMIEIGAAYARDYIAGNITERNDSAQLLKMFEGAFPGAQIKNYTDAEGVTYDNYYTILLPQVNFNDYLN